MGEFPLTLTSDPHLGRRFSKSLGPAFPGFGQVRRDIELSMFLDCRDSRNRPNALGPGRTANNMNPERLP